MACPGSTIPARLIRNNKGKIFLIWWHHDMQMSAFVALSEGNPLVNSRFPSQRARNANLWWFSSCLAWTRCWMNNGATCDFTCHNAHVMFLQGWLVARLRLHMNLLWEWQIKTNWQRQSQLYKVYEPVYIMLSKFLSEWSIHWHCLVKYFCPAIQSTFFFSDCKIFYLVPLT